MEGRDRVEGDRVWILVQARASDGARGPYGLRVSAASGETLAERPDFLAPGRTAEVVLPMSGPAPGRLGVALVGPDDGFPADNQAWLALEPRRRVTVMLLGPVDPSLRRALAARAGTTVIEAPPGAAPAEGVDLVVAQATALPDGWTGPAAVVGPGGAVGPVRPRAEPGPAAQWRVAEGHPLAAAFYLEPPRLSVAATYAADASAQLLLGTADAPLMVTWGGDGRRRLAVLFDLAEPATDWPRRAGFPIFWSRAVDWLVPGDERRAELRTYRPFEPVPGRNRLAPSRVGFQEGGGEVFGVSFIGTDEGFQAGPGRDDSRAAVEAVRASVAARREATLAAAWPVPAALALLALLVRARVAR